MKPLILLTGDTLEMADGRFKTALGQTYAAAVARAGGVPLLALEPTGAEACAAVADALILTGGADLNPTLYGGPEVFTDQSRDPARDTLEAALLPAFLAAGKPVLGICRGLQWINVHFGGTLVQHLPDLVGLDTHQAGTHTVTILADSKLAGVFGFTEAVVNSFHHQAADRLGEGLRAVAFCDLNGRTTVEALEHESLPILAAQWHPERMTGQDGGTDMAAIFGWLVGEAQVVAGK